jgi:hypothetical protein
MRLVPLLAAAATLLAAGPAAAQTPRDGYTHCAPVGQAGIVDVSAATCDEARTVATALLAAPSTGAAAVLRLAGWSPLRAADTGDGQHDVVATRGLAALRVRRPGPAPDLDGWSAGRELVFARAALVPGGRPPRGTVLCSSAFLVRLRTGRLGGLSAAHCGGTRRDGSVHRRNVALRRPPQPGIVLGRVVHNLQRSRPLDALVVPVPTGADRPAAAVVDRGVSRPPWSVAGVAQPLSGRRVCFSGRTSGADRCGRIVSRRARGAERLLSVFAGIVVRCTTIRAAEGDSGAAVYTAPRADGTVRAIGIAVIVVGSRARMCFTPVSPVLDALRARLVVQR